MMTKSHHRDLQLEEELQLRDAHPPRVRAPLPSSSPQGTPAERGPVDLRRGGELVFEIAQEHYRGGKESEAKSLDTMSSTFLQLVS
jgi:hypothetical protein